jgi:hypothetical protein
MVRALITNHRGFAPLLLSKRTNYMVVDAYVKHQTRSYLGAEE